MEKLLAIFSIALVTPFTTEIAVGQARVTESSSSQSAFSSASSSVSSSASSGSSNVQNVRDILAQVQAANNPRDIVKKFGKGVRNSSSSSSSSSSTVNGKNSFQGVITINGKKQRFTNEAEYRAALKKAFGGDMRKFPAAADLLRGFDKPAFPPKFPFGSFEKFGDGIAKGMSSGASSSSASSSASSSSSDGVNSFAAEITTDGKKQRFTNEAEYKAALRTAFGG